MSNTSPPKQLLPKGPLTTPQASPPPRPSPPPSQRKVLLKSNSVSEGTQGKNVQTSGIVTRSSTSSNKGSSKGSGKGSGKGLSTASSKVSSKVREEWFDETIFDNKRIKHEVKVKK